MILEGDYTDILELFDRLRPRGNRHWKACCPAHEDDNPSLDVGILDNGSLGIKCHKGCTLAEVLAALSQRAGRPVLTADLFPEGSKYGLRSEGWPRRRRRFKRVEIIERYNYLRADGSLAYQSVRVKPTKPGESKEFRQRRPQDGLLDPRDDAPGDWVWNLEGVSLVPYRLRQLIKARAERRDRWVFVCEGEKDADRAARDGLIATTNACGAGKFHLIEDVSAFEGANVAVVYDLDKIDPKRFHVPGYEHAMNVVCRLYGRAGQIRLVHLPILAGTGGDYSDWRDQTRLPPAKAREELWKILQESPAWSPWGPVCRPSPNPLEGSPVFLAHVLEQFQEFRKAGESVKNTQEAHGHLDVELSCLLQALRSKKPDPALLGARAVMLAARAMQAAEDLGWLGG